MKILIPTTPTDMHAICVDLALKQRKHESVLWYNSDFPSKECRTLSISADEEKWKMNTRHYTINHDDNVDVVWFRRPRRPNLSKELHEADREMARFENNIFFQSYWQTIYPKAIWVNPPENARRANLKIQQLQIAKKVGLLIPQTIISNHPDSIREFILRHHQHSGVIYKSLSPLRWEENNELHVPYTQQVDIRDLPSDPILQNMVGIYQERIEKKFELRVTCMGEKMIAVKIHSQHNPKSQQDWRKVSPSELQLELFVLPTQIQDKCKKLMNEMGLKFGCLDFIWTPKDECYFLEINEQGQFLWIEEAAPHIKMLETFVDFLTFRTDSHQSGELSLLRFIEKAKEIKNILEAL